MDLKHVDDSVDMVDAQTRAASQASSSSSSGTAAMSVPVPAAGIVVALPLADALRSAPKSHRKCALCGGYRSAGLKKVTRANAGLWSTMSGVRLLNGHFICAIHLNNDDMPVLALPAAPPYHHEVTMADLLESEGHLVRTVHDLWTRFPAHAPRPHFRSVHSPAGGPLLLPPPPPPAPQLQEGAEEFDFVGWTGLHRDNILLLAEMCPDVPIDDLVAALAYLRTGLAQHLLCWVLGCPSQQDLSRSIDNGRRALMKHVVPKFLSWEWSYAKSLEEDPLVLSAEPKSVTIVDTTTILTEASTFPELRARENSEYLQHQAVKFFVSITRSGRFIQLDGPYSPETSDSLILLEQLKPGSGFRKFLEQGFPSMDDEALGDDSTTRTVGADRGFLNAQEVLQELISKVWVSLEGDEAELATLLEALKVPRPATRSSPLSRASTVVSTSDQRLPKPATSSTSSSLSSLRFRSLPDVDEL